MFNSQIVYRPVNLHQEPLLLLYENISGRLYHCFSRIPYDKGFLVIIWKSIEIQMYTGLNEDTNPAVFITVCIFSLTQTILIHLILRAKKCLAEQQRGRIISKLLPAMTFKHHYLNCLFSETAVLICSLKSFI